MLPLIMPGAPTGGSYDLSGLSYANKYATISGQVAGQPFAVELSVDGLAMYVLDGDQSKVYQYTLSSAWDVSTASYASKLYTATAQLTAPRAVRFSADGTKMYLVGTTAIVYQYTLSTPWDVSTASYASKSLSLTSQMASSTAGLCLSSDGTKLYAMYRITGVVYQYTLATPWDLSTGSYASISEDISAQAPNNYGIDITPDGTRFFANDNGSEYYQYGMGTPYNVSTTSYGSVMVDLDTQDTDMRGFCFGDNGRFMYVVGQTRIYQYRL